MELLWLEGPCADPSRAALSVAFQSSGIELLGDAFIMLDESLERRSDVPWDPADAPSRSPAEPPQSTGYAGSPSVTGENLAGKSAGTSAGPLIRAYGRIAKRLKPI